MLVINISRRLPQRRTLFNRPGNVLDKNILRYVLGVPASFYHYPPFKNAGGEAFLQPDFHIEVAGRRLISRPTWDSDVDGKFSRLGGIDRDLDCTVTRISRLLLHGYGPAVSPDNGRSGDEQVDVQVVVDVSVHIARHRRHEAIDIRRAARSGTIPDASPPIRGRKKAVCWVT